MLTKEEYLLSFENLLDSFHIYSFKNWFLGKIISGPHIKKHLVEISLIFEHHQKPDFFGAMRLEKIGVKVEYELSEMEDTNITLNLSAGIGKNAANWNPGARLSPGRQTSRENIQGDERLPKKKVWIVKLTIPKNLLDEDFSILNYAKNKKE